MAINGNESERALPADKMCRAAEVFSMDLVDEVDVVDCVDGAKKRRALRIEAVEVGAGICDWRRAADFFQKSARKLKIGVDESAGVAIFLSP